MTHKVILDLREDYNTGDWGFAPQNTLNDGINAAFTATMIFHDVFEHWHEEKHKYFKGNNAFNVAGEVAAMGAMWYYYEDILGKRLSSGWKSPQQEAIDTTLMYMQEAIKYSHFPYGETLNSEIPYQKPVESGDLEYIIQQHWEQVKKLKPESIEGKEYKDSITKAKLANLYRWGYRMAEKIGLDYDAAYDFWEYFEGFCKANTPEYLANYFNSMEVTYNKKTYSWKAYLITHEGKKVRLKAENAKYSLDYYDLVY